MINENRAEMKIGAGIFTSEEKQVLHSQSTKKKKKTETYQYGFFWVFLGGNKQQKKI